MSGEATVIVQITDTHIGPHGARPYGTDTAENFRMVARTIAEMNLPLAGILLTGDLSDAGLPESYEHLRELVTSELDPLGAPVLPVIGNHDHRASFRQAYLGEEGAGDDDPYHYTVDLGSGAASTRVIMCDSYLADATTGVLGDEQRAWLASEIDGAGDRTTVVAMHHPSVPRGVPRANDFLLEDRRELHTVLEGRSVAAILVGHSHVSACSSFAGALHAAAPASAYLLDPSRSVGGRAYEGAGFAICTVRDGRAVVNPFVVSPGAPTLYEH